MCLYGALRSAVLVVNILFIYLCSKTSNIFVTVQFHAVLSFKAAYLSPVEQSCIARLTDWRQKVLELWLF